MTGFKPSGDSCLILNDPNPRISGFPRHTYIAPGQRTDMTLQSSVLTLLFLLIIGIAGIISGCTAPQFGQAPADGNIAPGPTQTLPPGKNVVLQINEKDTSYQTVTVIFAGGEGQIAVTDILLVYTRADGTSEQKHLPATKGAEIVFQGTKETDRIQGYVTLNTGATYKIVDQPVPYRTRG